MKTNYIQTPGPWEIRRCTDGAIGITGRYHIPAGLPAVMGGHLHVCDLSGDVHHDEGNARLIAAAPDLLKACREAQAYLTDPAIQDWLNRSGHKSNDYGKAVLGLVAAIAKAEGAQ